MMNYESRVKGLIRELEATITPNEMIAQLRDGDGRLADIAERQNRHIRSEVERLKNLILQHRANV